MEHANYYAMGYAYGLMAKRAQNTSANKICSDLSLQSASMWPVRGIGTAHFALIANKLMTDELSEMLTSVLSQVDEISDDEQATSGPERCCWQMGYRHALAGKKPLYSSRPPISGED